MTLNHTGEIIIHLAEIREATFPLPDRRSAKSPGENVAGRASEQTS